MNPLATLGELPDLIHGSFFTIFIPSAGCTFVEEPCALIRGEVYTTKANSHLVYLRVNRAGWLNVVVLPINLSRLPLAAGLLSILWLLGG